MNAPAEPSAAFVKLRDLNNQLVELGVVRKLQAAIEDVYRLESQLTAARRSVAELRAWVEGEIAKEEGRAREAWRSRAFSSHDSANSRLVAWRTMLDRLTDPSPAAPADAAKETP